MKKLNITYDTMDSENGEKIIGETCYTVEFANDAVADRLLARGTSGVAVAELKNDPDVHLAWKEKSVWYKRRRYLATLQSEKRRGQQLREAGITWEMLDEEENVLKQLDS